MVIRGGVNVYPREARVHEIDGRDRSGPQPCGRLGQRQPGKRLGSVDRRRSGCRPAIGLCRSDSGHTGRSDSGAEQRGSELAARQHIHLDSWNREGTKCIANRS